MSSSYKTIHFGLLILAFNFYFENIDIFPDFLGFIIISKGLRDLIEYNYEIEHFRKGKYISDFMILVTFIQYIVGFNVGNSIESFTIGKMIYFALGNFFNIVVLLVIYFILKGIYKIAENRKLKEYMCEINSAWNNKWIVTVITVIGSSFIINGQSTAIAIMTIVSIVAIIIQIRGALVVKRAGSEFE